MMRNDLGRELYICGCFVTQPIGDFFVGVIPSDILCEITYTDTRRIDERLIERHAGLNRPVNPARVKEISEYVQLADATFPNSVIIAIDSENIVAQDDHSLTIRLAPDVAKIIDGQHRISGLQSARPSNFELVVAIFVDLEIEDQATIFSTINLKQARVDKSLVYDLFDLATERSPQKTCHEIAKSLNFDELSPFYKRIKLLGRNPKLGDGTVLYKAPLSQAAFVKYLLPMISENPERDRDLLRRDQPIHCADNSVDRGIIFCEYFSRDEDATIVRILTNYFNAVREVFPREWEEFDNPLSRTIGYGALMRLFQNVLYVRGKKRKTFKAEYFRRYLETMSGNLEFSFDRYHPAGSGETNLYRDMKDVVEASDFYRQEIEETTPSELVAETPSE